MSANFEKDPVQVSLEYPLFQSEMGHYFIGQTPYMSAANQYALGCLMNPAHSRRLIYVNAITITNISGYVLSADVYLRATFAGGYTSNLVTCVNTSIFPEPEHRGQIVYVPDSTQAPVEGVSIFSRISSPTTTLVIDGNQTILAPGENLIVYISGIPLTDFSNVKVAFGWWEEEAFHHC